MGRRQQIPKDLGGTLVLGAPDRPTAATVTIYDKYGTALVTGGTATVDAVATTISAWSSAAPTAMTLTSVTGVTVGRDYRIRLTTGETHICRVTGVNTSSKAISIQDPPSITPAAGAAFESLRVSYAIAPSVLTLCDEGYRALWSLTISSATVRTEQIFDVVYSPARNPGTAAGLRRHKPTLTSLWDQVATGNTWDTAVASAYEQVLDDLETQMLQSGKSLAYALVDWDQLERVIYERVLADHADVLMPKIWDGYPESWLSTRRAEYYDSMERFLRGVRYLDPENDRKATVKREEVPTFVRYG